MEADPQLFMATGYPFDLVAAPSSSSSGSSWWGRLLAYAAASYHLPLLIGFSVADRGGFVWGGAMMLRAGELQKAAAEEAAAQEAAAEEAAAAAAAGGSCGVSSKPNILQVWRQGGYSDDLLLAAFCTEHGLPIGMPASAYFPQHLPATYTAKQYWNYLRRQLYLWLPLLLWLGWVLENGVLPFCMAYCYFCDHIVWGGITYYKQGGKSLVQLADKLASGLNAGAAGDAAGDAAAAAQQQHGHTYDHIDVMVATNFNMPGVASQPPLDEALVTLAMTGWAEAKLRHHELLSRQYQRYFPQDVHVGHPRAPPKLFNRLICQEGAVPSSWLMSEPDQSKGSDIWLLPTLRPTAASEFIDYVISPPIGRWVGFPVGTTNVEDVDNCLVLATRLEGCTDVMWQKFRLKLLGHLYGIRLTIYYTNALDVAAPPLSYTLGRDYYKNETDQLRELLGLPSTDDQKRISDLAEGPGQWVLLVDAGLAQSCSQKIHNVLGGIEVALAAMQQQHQQQQQSVLQGHQQQQQQQQLDHHQQHHNTHYPSNSTTTWGSGSLDSNSSSSSSSSGGYVAVLDDDVALHPLSLCQMVDEMEADSQLFMATGG
ncbi:hypothetical protein OEZ86_010544 [Tetradesmus obliquus]|nr:hypothetical protein OEZ86_010544 [Tetradesmus obliquus]